MAKRTKKASNFVSANENAKSKTVSQIVRLARKAHLDYDGFIYVCQEARKQLGLKRPKRKRILPQLLPDSELKRFFKIIQQCGNLQHEIMLKFLFYTALRVSELVKIKVSDIDIENCKIFIQQGKGFRDRYILFPENFRLVLKTYLKSNPANVYLFETTRNGPFTTRRVQQIVQEYRKEASIEQKIHPHLFRHQMITYLTSKGLSDAQIQLISGHESKKSLEVYQHLSLESTENAYQQAVGEIGI